ncbi:hypothetical protein GCM10017774_17670 [Lentzea cavernae]|uniref:Uncharacterized protein n=1 Tax=Lentzea cavernae TaxID=2020703 RepID=A0ABQ3M759_9PSEU|nr:hypothetical protein GCM10017774_17670 [Lentzea cavernae]
MHPDSTPADTVPRTVFRVGSSARDGVGKVGGGADVGGSAETLGETLLGGGVAVTIDDVSVADELDAGTSAGGTWPHEARTTHSSTAANRRMSRHLRWTTATGHGAWWSTAWLTEPRIARFTAPRP